MIRFYTDHYFSIGHAHFVGGKPCQDYAASGVFGDSAFAIVSDGCSTGGKTDVGARVIALSTAEAIRRHFALNAGKDAINEEALLKINLWQKAVISGARNMLGLEAKDMLATSFYACVTPEGGCINLQGDGVVAIKDLRGNIYMSRIEWSDNMPFYPAYAESGLEGFIAAHGGDLKALKVKKEYVRRIRDGDELEAGHKELSLKERVGGISMFIDPVKLEHIEFIALFSDGITQVDGMDWKDAVREFLAFKNITGEFAKRRMIRGIKDAQESGKGPIDDIAYAVIRIGREENSEEDGHDSC